MTARRIVVTGAAGFIGRRIVAVLRERGDHMVGPVRDPLRATHLADLGVELVGTSGGTSSGACATSSARPD